MATKIWAKKNDAGGYVFHVALLSMATPGSYQVNPTLASGDVKISKDGGALANLNTLPSVEPASSIWVKVTLSQSEANADECMIQFIDQTATKEWTDLAIVVLTAARNVEDLAFPTISGRSIDVDASGGVEIGDAAQTLANLSKTVQAIGRGTVTTGASTTSVPTSSFSPAGAATDQFKGRVVLFDANTTTAALRGAAALIEASSNAANPTFTVTALPATPASGDTFSVV